MPIELGALYDLPGKLDEEGQILHAIPHSAEIGMLIHYADSGQAILSVPWSEELVGDPETGVMHGGVVTVLLDTSCGTAVMSVKEKVRTTATLDLRIDYMRPASTGKRIYCHAECYRMTRSIGFTRAIAFHEDPHDPVATASGAFMIERMESKS
ncbi:PaaI family thioesterase [Rhodobacteraceae bacterium NNCM2]|nr:PaaI family thioesterase [Coraliihabitans acroporae]